MAIQRVRGILVQNTHLEHAAPMWPGRVVVFVLAVTTCGAGTAPPPDSADAACLRNRAQAIELSREGDRLFSIDVGQAIQKYLLANRLYPAEHRILWKLAAAYERREEWPQVAEVLARAVELAPNFANYWFRLGYALIHQAEAGDPSAYERSKAPLQRCVALDPNIAECHFLLAEASLWTKDDRAALLGYTEAIRRSPSTGFFYPPLAELYLNLRMVPRAEAVLKEGLRLIAKTEQNDPALFASYQLLGTIASRRGDSAALLWAMERAEQHAGEDHPESAFNLGATYATMSPPDPERAKRLLRMFLKRVCAGAARARFAEQCDVAHALVLRLGEP